MTNVARDNQLWAIYQLKTGAWRFDCDCDRPSFHVRNETFDGIKEVVLEHIWKDHVYKLKD